MTERRYWLVVFIFVPWAIIGIVLAVLFFTAGCGNPSYYDRQTELVQQAQSAIEPQNKAPPAWLVFYVQGLTDVQHRYNQGLFVVWDNYDRQWKAEFSKMCDVNETTKPESNE